jgi:cytochrome P450
VVEGLVTEKQLEAAGVAVMELSGYIIEQFQRAAANPQDNLLGDLATACATGELADMAALTMMITLFSAGGESTASLIGSAAWIFTTHPNIQQQVRDHPHLLGAFIEEVLRYEPPFRGLPACRRRHRTVRRGTAGGFAAAPPLGCSQSRPVAL